MKGLTSHKSMALCCSPYGLIMSAVCHPLCHCFCLTDVELQDLHDFSGLVTVGIVVWTPVLEVLWK